MLEIGKIVSVHGVKGEVCIAHNIINQLPNDDLDVLMLELMPQSFIPFFIEKIRKANEGEWICKLEEVDTREDAKELLHKKVYLYHSEGIETKTGSEWEQYVDYTIFDVEKGLIGRILSIESMGAQALASIMYHEHEVQIPMHKDLIQEIKPDTKTLVMNLPHGLLDL